MSLQYQIACVVSSKQISELHHPSANKGQSTIWCKSVTTTGMFEITVFYHHNYTDQQLASNCKHHEASKNSILVFLLYHYCCLVEHEVLFISFSSNFKTIFFSHRHLIINYWLLLFRIN
jgi:hypothetical protein